MRPQKLNIGLDEAQAWALDLYGIRATASGLPGEIDRNILLTAESGDQWVLKLAPAGADRTEIQCQLAVLEHLARTDLKDLVPRIVPQRDGAISGTVLTAAGDEGLLRMVTYLPGRPLATCEQPTSDLRREIGHYLARLDLALATFDHPGARRRLVWDLARVLELQPLLASVDENLRPRVAAGLDAFAARVEPRLSELPAGVIHNDANDYNLLVEGTGSDIRLSGIIDFGDMVHTVTVAEPAIACAYAMLDQADPRAAANDIIAGYESARPLTDLERTLLPDLIIARLCNSLLMSAQARTMAPDDEYLRISERPVAALLERLTP